MKRFILLMLMLATIPATVTARNYKFDKHRTDSRVFKAGTNPTLDSELKYSKLVITHWNKPEIGVRVEINTSSDDAKVAEKLLDVAVYTMQLSGSTLYLKGSIDSDLNNELQRRSRRKSFSITYYVSLPTGTKMNLVSKYGNVNIDKATRAIKADVKYGNVKVDGDLAAEGSFVIGYGNLNINNASAKQNITIKYGNVSVNETKDINIESAYSNLTARSAGVIKGSSRYGNFKLGNITSLKLSNASYGTFSIESLVSDLELIGLRYSNLRVNNVSSSFRSINIPDAGYTDIKIRIPKESFKASLRTSYARISIYDKHKSDRSINTTLGNNPSATVSIANKYGNISIMK